MVTRVDISPLKKALAKAQVPKPIVKMLQRWIDDVETNGMAEARKRIGYHDEPLTGSRKGQRSVRLSQQWRAIYVETADGTTHLVEVREVTAHDYR